MIIVGTSLVEFDYDKAVISYKTQDKDSVINYTSQSFIGNNNIMRYYWSSDPNITTYSSEINAIYDLVPDNSTVTLKGEYFKNGDLLQTEFDTLFCKKGVGNTYPIRKYE